jgi:aryl-alcohol dehydrogenase-like predicted oxidoreductase
MSRSISTGREIKRFDILNLTEVLMERPEMRTVSGALPGRVALGTMLFGTGIEEEKAFSLLTAHACRPGAQIDTARSYASWLPGGAGKSEMTIGKWLEKAGRECREQIFLGTKGCLMPRGYNSTRGDLSPERIRNELEESLEALRTDYIDLYWLHRDEEGRDPGEILKTMNCLVREGKIRYFGVSNWKASRILEADAWAKARRLQPISASQIQFGFGVCTPERWGDQSVVCMDSREYAVYRRLQMPVYTYSAQSEGYFARILSGEKEKLSGGTIAKYNSSVNQIRARRLKELRELRRNEGRPCPPPGLSLWNTV